VFPLFVIVVDVGLEGLHLNKNRKQKINEANLINQFIMLQEANECRMGLKLAK